MKSKIEKLMLGFSLLPLSLSAVAYDKADERIIDQHMQIVVDSIKAKQIAPIMALMPLKYGVNSLRAPMLYGHGIGAIWQDILIMLAISIVAIAVAVRFFTWDSVKK